MIGSRQAHAKAWRESGGYSKAGQVGVKQCKRLKVGWKTLRTQGDVVDLTKELELDLKVNVTEIIEEIKQQDNIRSFAFRKVTMADRGTRTEEELRKKAGSTGKRLSLQYPDTK